MDENNTFYSMHVTDKKSLLVKFSIIGMLIIMVLLILISIINKRVVVEVIKMSNINNLGAPIQTDLDVTEEIKKLKGYEVEKVASIEITGRIISIREYYENDKSREYKEVIDKVSPIDMCILWGKLSTNKNDLAVSFYEKADRYVDYKINDKSVLGHREVIMSMSNTNLIPKTNRIKKELQTFETGEIIKIKGYLVNLYDTDEILEPSITSLVRTDQGRKGNEIILVEKVYRIEKEDNINIDVNQF